MVSGNPCPIHLGQVCTCDTDPAPEREPFVWPCDKRRAHGPHIVDSNCTCGYARRKPDMAVNPNYHKRDCDYRNRRRCPGVLAHPDTMIGGAHPEFK